MPGHTVTVLDLNVGLVLAHLDHAAVMILCAVSPHRTGQIKQTGDCYNALVPVAPQDNTHSAIQDKTVLYAVSLDPLGRLLKSCLSHCRFSLHLSHVPDNFTIFFFESATQYRPLYVGRLLAQFLQICFILRHLPKKHLLDLVRIFVVDLALILADGRITDAHQLRDLFYSLALPSQLLDLLDLLRSDC